MWRLMLVENMAVGTDYLSGHVFGSFPMLSQQINHYHHQRQERDDTEKPDEQRQLSAAKRPRQSQILKVMAKIQTITSAHEYTDIS
jgi:hypothetical protein